MYTDITLFPNQVCNSVNTLQDLQNIDVSTYFNGVICVVLNTQGLYFYNKNSMAVPDGINIVKPNYNEVGRWILYNPGGSGGLQPIAAQTILANPSGATEVPIATALDSTLGFINNKLAVVSAPAPNLPAQTLYGNPTGSSATAIPITLGTNLSFSGSVLNATGGGGSDITWNNITSFTVGVNIPVFVKNGYIFNCASTAQTPVIVPRIDVVPPSVGDEIKFLIVDSHPIGSSYLSSFLNVSGASVRIIDSNSVNFTASMLVNGKGISFTLRYIGSSTFSICDISVPQGVTGTIFSGA